MPFTFKLAQRLARLKDRLAVAALATAVACEQPTQFTDPTGLGLTQIVVSPESTYLDPAQTQQFVAFGRTTAGDSVNVIANWAASLGTITTGGLYTADTSASDILVTASLQGSNLTGTARIRKRRLVKLSINPHRAVLQELGRQQFTTFARRNTGDSIAVPVSYAGTGGTITTSGLYGAGATPGSYSVVASYGAMADTAAVTITPLAVWSVAVSPATANLFPGGSLQLIATPQDSTGATLTGRAITWSSSATGIATIDASGLVRGVALGTTTITAASEGKSGTATITVVNVPVASVLVAPASANVMVGQTAQFVATPKDSAGNSLAGRLGTWSSSATAVATVDANGLVKGVGPGTATITATTEGKSGTATITVASVPVASVQVAPSSASVMVGLTAQFVATPKDSAGNPLAGRVGTWSSSATAVATVDGNGLVKGVSQGTATITATSEGKSGTATITVVNVPVASVQVAPTAANLLVGQIVQLTATPKDSAGNPLTGRVATWSSSAPAVATVDANGVVKGVSSGTATITATSEGKSGTATITVANVPVASVSISPAALNGLVGQTGQFTATPKDSAGNPLTGRVVTWSSSAPNVATVDANGVAKGVSPGTATITATSEGKSGSATVTVANVPVATVSVLPASASIRLGATQQLSAVTKDSTGTILNGRAIAWASSNAAVATVSSSGLVTGTAAGTATITATSEGKSGTATVTVTLVPVASVVVSPATATLPAQGTLQLSVTLKDSAGNVLTGRSVSWASSAPTVATVSQSGLVTDVADGGSTTITATSEGKSGTAAITVQAAPPPGTVPDPTLLPVAAMQAPNVAAYAALNVPAQPAGYTYNDPVTAVKIWKVTSPTVPTANVGAGHDYGEGGAEASRGWGPNGNTHTLLIRGDKSAFQDGLMPYYLVDFTRGVGFSNYRQLTVQPRRDLCASFSNLVGQERILYIHTGTQLIRYNTQTMQTENTGNFPLTTTIFAWLHQDRNDVWFTGLLADNLTVWVWNSQTNQYATHLETWNNEPHLERDGHYVVLTSGGTPSTTLSWDLSTLTLGTVQSVPYFSHLASLRSLWVAVNPNVTAPFEQDRYQVSGSGLVSTTILAQSAGGEVNMSGNWIQSDTDLGGNLNRQWAYTSGTDETQVWANSTLWRQAVGVERADGSDQRLLLHHYTHLPTYFDLAWGQPSPDGTVVIFNSNMYGSGRYDLFVAEVPLR